MTITGVGRWGGCLDRSDFMVTDLEVLQTGGEYIVEFRR